MRLFKVLLILLLLISIRGLAQNGAPNIGFENGTFSNWQCYIGSVDSLGIITMNPTPPIYNRQTLIGNSPGNTLDPFGNFPIGCPNGSKYSIRLGNQETGAQAERVTYTLDVPTGRAYSIILNYAVVLENPNHSPFQQPKFTAQVYDVTDGKYIDCPYFNFVASSDLPGFKLSTVPGARGASIYYKDWSTATIDLRGYLGKTIRLEFTTNDCTLGGHFGYAYLDLDENIGSAIAGNSYCSGQKSITLYAPNGFASYIWYNSDFSQQIGTGQSITISPPPPDLTMYALKILPYPELGCVDTIFTVVNQLDRGFKLNVLDTIYGCPGTGVDLTAASVTAGSSQDLTLSYFNDSLATSHLYTPNAVVVSGVYYIKGINSGGCLNVLPVHVIVGNPAINVTDPNPVVFPVTVDLSKTYPHQKGLTYSYWSDPDATVPVENYTALQYGGVYYIKVVNVAGCITKAPVNVVIYPPAPYTITAPNVFTPNNDGINDHFMVTVTGKVTCESINIYNRYGQVVFTSKSPDDYWDGNFNGHALPVGTYYWVFEGIDNYYKTKINRAASISLLR